MENIPDVMIERAVELWCRKLHDPVFDNGDKTEQGFFTGVLANTNIQADKNKIDDMGVRVEKFRKALVRTLKTERDSADYFYGHLSVDYAPCIELGLAANEAGIPESQFSCKSAVAIFEGWVVASFGYAAESTYHYPLPDGKWLVTSLVGSDINKVIKQVMDGNLMGLEVD